ncbi:MAG: hypothetical protein HYW89_00180 [Candidatus Sungiibacteriota bacterium]|uniref:Uncharacterized protein n=1 Tax=Candidatus Sungiibacteriota bacterium TaxID=2750080 RepID=A0A7T5UQN0_9BACT|nr:MAG: hypothetical protein HYW89_00180 [Candidatus Sungbacteria bacterium]
MRQSQKIPPCGGPEDGQESKRIKLPTRHRGQCSEAVDELLRKIDEVLDEVELPGDLKNQICRGEPQIYLCDGRRVRLRDILGRH